MRLDRLLGNPHAQPPLPLDWEVHPTHPVHTVPYALASLWDARRAEEERKAKNSRKRKSVEKIETVGQVPKALKDKLKRSRGAKGLLQDLEEEVRQFLQNYKNDDSPNKENQYDARDYLDDDDYVMVSRSPQHSRNSSLEIIEAHREKLLFSSSLDEDSSASFV